MTRIRLSVFAAAVLLGSASPALADGHGGGSGGGSATWSGGGAWSGGWGSGWNGGWVYPVMPYQGVYTVTAPTVSVPQQVAPPLMAYPQQPDPRWQEMAQRCAAPPRADNGLGGAAIGGVVGGVIGNRVADGDRLLGTVAGAAVGAVAGAVIDKAEDKDKDRALREECDAWFAHNGPPQGYYPGGYPGAAYGYPGYIMVPVMIPGEQKPCVETTTVTEEWVPVTTRQRNIPRRPVHRDKRVKEKRVYTGS